MLVKHVMLAMQLFFGAPQSGTNHDLILVSDNSSSVTNPPLKWVEPPNILICHSSAVSERTVFRAVQYWNRLGYEFGSIRKAAADDFVCARGIPDHNQILVDIPSQGFAFGKHIAITRTWYHTDTEVAIKAKIEIMGGWENTARVLEHELGHALGWKDNAVTGHIMNGTWAHSGVNSRGLRKP